MFLLPAPETTTEGRSKIQKICFKFWKIFFPSQCNVVSYKEKKICESDPAVGEKKEKGKKKKELMIS